LAVRSGLAHHVFSLEGNCEEKIIIHAFGLEGPKEGGDLEELTVCLREEMIFFLLLDN
jgi:hypothetical protein